MSMNLDPTSRELQCLTGVAHGRTTSAIALELGLSVRTVDHHIANVMRKLDAPTRAAAVAQGMYRGLLQMTPRQPGF
ncbi:MAG: helix-turn-helix transcriptional regulator [Pseudomonadales bacterium]